VAEHRFGQLILPPDLHATVLARARAEAPLECCGFLAGRIHQNAGMVERCYPLINAAASPVEFISDARSTFDAMGDMDQRGLEVLAVYHSHPTTPPVPSKTDLERNYSPDVVNVIVSLQTDPPLLRGWWLRDAGFEEAEIVTGRQGATPN
jgi:[CysO sulfur-carrier protein]-S-L-cysteine hydrolase